ncbi:hypothetical protein KGF57_003121 [Candida theae]|uniref:Zn(2)-C6 fungal-type domain-containing protein n=1 Tax=Candida theae TaxID=1198502 RepID=A0AAD5BE19_9ASCO|nr:uncharacterized protein KGF57_003121 [Candida theae]KAI5957854.1 hypothetical protein KGF57_003121 [Candida theae]
MLVTFSSRRTSENSNHSNERSTSTMTSKDEAREEKLPAPPTTMQSAPQLSENTFKRVKEGPTTAMKARQLQNSFQVSLTRKNSLSKSSSNSATTANSLLIKGPRDFHKFKENGRSRSGCLTCKIRKKKCDEVRPICSDCKRLHKKCYYIDQSSMTTEEIRNLKRKVEADESNHKLRRRKKTVPKLGEDQKQMETGSDFSTKSPSQRAELKPEKKFNPLMVPVGSRGITSPTGIQGVLHADNIARHLPYETMDPLVSTSNHEIFTFPLSDRGQSATTLSSLRSTAGQNSNEANQLEIKFENPFTLDQSSSSTNQLTPHQTDSLDDALGSFKYPHPADDVSMDSPSAFLNLLREINNSTTSDHKFEELDDSKFDEFKHLAAASPEVAPDVYAMIESFDQARSHENMDRSLIASSPSFPNLVSTLNAHFNPSPKPQPSLLSIPELADPSISYLYNYYVDVISNKVSVAPSSQNESNSYQKIFLPLAQKDKGVLYSILAWAGFQLGGKWETEASNFVKKALQHFHKSSDNTNTTSTNTTTTNNNNNNNNPALTPYNGVESDRSTIINKLATLMILVGANICKGDVTNWTIYLRWGWKLLASNGGILRFNQSKEENWLISNFAYHDLLASSTSERGTYFTSRVYNKIFEDHDVFFLRGQLNPLLGISKKLFTIIGEISTLLYESKKLLHEYYSRGVDNHFEKSKEFLSEFLHAHDDELRSTEEALIEEEEEEEEDEFSNASDHYKANQLLSFTITKAKKLERQIDESKPDKGDICNLSDSDLELQLTLFEAFQLSAKLFLRESILRCNPSHLESQMINNNLIKCLDILIGTPVQASLVFPVFISGIHCVSKHDQELMLQRVNSFIEQYGMFNANRAREVMQKIWKENSSGDKVTNWHSMLNDLGWDLNFA